MVETSTAIYSRTLSHKCATREFCLLRFRPGPVHSSLDDLVTSSSPKNHHIGVALRRTFDRHRIAEDRTLNHKPSNSLDLHRSWITRPRHKSRSNIDIKSSYIKAVAGGVSSVILR
ncbi:hypothetical protein CEXT_650151 [Caerostris extrusa]|uniref:Uncharacterized protein n=1 Tax=Caerostris extrusa TaxID=172846 RepID=A0AAV4MXW0_CAEEX|nr:hypothetical protein CEXT_650151 [Caerostris extrusa]